MKIIHGYGAISKWHKRRKSEDFLPQLLWWYHANFVTDKYNTILRFVHAHAMPNFSEFISNALMSYGLALVIPLIPVRSLSTMFSPRTLSRGQQTCDSHKFQRIQILTIQIWKTNGTNRKFIILLKLKAKRIKK